MRTQPLSLIALTGFLGSGKTTLLEHWLAHSPVPPEKSALVINDFGPVNIDALLLGRPNLQLLSIAGGCVCCTTFAELIDALAQLAESTELEVIWMETSGLAEPDEILDHLTSPRLQGKIRVQRLIQVIDAVHYPGSWRVRALEEEQLRYADWIILNKTDRVTAAKLHTLTTKIRGINPHAELRTATHGETDWNGFWDAHEFPALDSATTENAAHDHSSHDEHDDHDGHDHEHEPVAAATLYFPLTQPIPRAEFDRFLQELPDTIYRAKGFVRFAEEPAALHTFQQVAEQQETLLLPVRGEKMPAPGLVFIGPQLDEVWLKKRLAPWIQSASTGTRLKLL